MVLVCLECGHKFEVDFKKMLRIALLECPKCGHKAENYKFDKPGKPLSK